MSDSDPAIIPEVRLVRPGETHLLCRCGASPCMPDCRRQCSRALELRPVREQRLLLCRCARSASLPFCDGSHAPAAPTLSAKWRRFIGRS